MTAAAWACDSCHTNNLAQATVCRVCQLPPGSATGQANQIPVHQEPVHQQTAQPQFVDSRYGAPSQQQTPFQQPPPTDLPMITLTGSAAPTPAAPGRGAPPPSRTALWLVAIGVILLLLLVIALATDLPKAFSSGSTSTSDSSYYESSSSSSSTDSSPSSPPSDSSDSSGSYSGSLGSSASTSETPTPQASSSTPCPEEVARWLPDGGSGSELVAGYLADHHIVTICRDSDGDLHYDGQVRGKEPSDQTHISIYATETPTGFSATNNGYVYDITDDVLTVVDDKGNEVLRSDLTRTGP